MSKSEYTGGLQYVNIPSSHKKKKRKQNIVWFNPSFSKHVKTIIKHKFLRMLMKHFLLTHRLFKIYNKNNNKVNYSCVTSMASIIPEHNKNPLDDRTKSNYAIPPCNCRNKANYPLEGRCCQSSILYKAPITSGGGAMHYYGCSETEFKACFYNHYQSFKY